MQNINWDMMTQFVFPEQLGVVEEVLSVEIKPIWQQIETDESIRLVGIYHIAATARFNPHELPEYSDGTYIEELEFEGNNGYFEYALPLEIDLPRDKVASESRPQVSINDVSYFVYNGSNCTFKWDVDCQFEESVEGALFHYEVENSSSDQPLVSEEIRFNYDAIIPEQPVIPEQPTFTERTEVSELTDESISLNERVKGEETSALQEESQMTEEIRFGNDAIFPEEQPTVPEQTAISEQPTVPEQTAVSEQPTVPEQSIVSEQSTTKEQPIALVQPEVEGTTDTSGQTPVEQFHLNIESSSKKEHEKVVLDSYESSIKAVDHITFSSGDLVKNEDETEKPEAEKKERVVESNQYFPTDADDFYQELTESYTILNFSNKILRK